MLNQLSFLQETYRAFLGGIDKLEDKDFREAFVIAPGLDRNAVIALATIAHEAFPRHTPGETHEDDEDAIMFELVLAGEIIDHLDTLGWKLIRS